MTKNLVARACLDELGATVLTERPDDYERYNSVSLCVLDSVFSIRARYEQHVLPTVRRYARFAGIELSRDGRDNLPETTLQQTLTELIGAYQGNDTETFAADVLKNRQRTSTRSGILNWEAAGRFAIALHITGGIDYLQDVGRAADDPRLEAELRAIPGQRSGITTKYFFMLSGDEDLVKPDMWLLRFLSRSVGRSVRPEEVTHLVREAVGVLSPEFPHLTPRRLDHRIWGYERSRPSHS